jgi:hypothetical protein
MASRIWVSAIPPTPDSSLDTTYGHGNLATGRSLFPNLNRLLHNGNQATFILRHGMIIGDLASILQRSRRTLATVTDLRRQGFNLSQSGTVSWDPTATPTPTYLGLGHF